MQWHAYIDGLGHENAVVEREMLLDQPGVVCLLAEIDLLAQIAAVVAAGNRQGTATNKYK